MDEISLFDEKIRTRLGPRKYNEKTYDYLDSSGRESRASIRKYLEECFKLYPSDEKEEIKNRLKTREHFDSTFFEIYLYRQFIEDGFTIQSHPKIEGTDNRPDFLLSKDNQKIYLEAKVDYNKSNKERSRENKKNEIMDIINSINIEGYRISLEKIEFKNTGQPSLQKFKRKIKLLSENLEHSYVLDKTQNEILDLKSREYEDDNLILKFKVFAVDETYKDKRLVQIDSTYKAKWINCSKSIRESLNKKTSRYGNMNTPFIIAINCLDFFADEDEVRSGVLGDYHENNGFFSCSEPNKNSNVSGVLIYNLYLGGIDSPKYWFILNPNAEYPIDMSLFSFDSIKLKDGEFISVCKG